MCSMVDVASVRGIPGGRGTLVRLERADGSPLVFSRRLFNNKRSNLQVYEAADRGGGGGGGTSPVSSIDPGDAVVVKRVGNSARIREELAAIELLARSPVPGFVPTVSLPSQNGRSFAYAGHAYFAMPLMGRDMVDFQAAERAAVPAAVWIDTVVSVLSAVAATLLDLWRAERATYYDIKARNILALRDITQLQPPFGHHEVVLCDTGSINSPCGTHHPPTALTRHASPHTEARYRLYIAWGMACTMVEMVDGPDLPRAIRKMRHLTTDAPLQQLSVALGRVLEVARPDPDAYQRVGMVVELVSDAVNGGTVENLLASLASC